MSDRVIQLFFNKTQNGESKVFVASGKNLNQKNNKVGIFTYGVFDGATVTLKAKPVVTPEEQNPSSIAISDGFGSNITLKENSLVTIDLIDQIQYLVEISGANASTSISIQIIYDL